VNSRIFLREVELQVADPFPKPKVCKLLCMEQRNHARQTMIQTAPLSGLPVDIRSEQLLSLPQAARRFPPYRQDRPVNPSTLWRWISAGVKLPDGHRIKLGAVRLSGRWLTSVEAIERFIAAQTPNPDNTPAEAPSPRTPKQRQRASAKAASELEQMGV